MQNTIIDIATAFREIKSDCFLNVCDGFSDVEIVVVAYAGHMAYSKGMQLTLADLAHIKATVTQMLAQETPAGIEAPAETPEMVDLMDGYYVREGDIAIAWVPTRDEAVQIDQTDPDFMFGRIDILPISSSSLLPQDFIPFLNKYYAENN